MAKSTVGGYPQQRNGKWILTGYRDGAGITVSKQGHRIGCTKIRPGAAGSWIDTHRCSYRFKIKGAWYSCRGYGANIAVSCHRMKNPPRGSGSRRKRRR